MTKDYTEFLLPDRPDATRFLLGLFARVADLGFIVVPAGAVQVWDLIPVEWMDRDDCARVRAGDHIVRVIMQHSRPQIVMRLGVNYPAELLWAPTGQDYTDKLLWYLIRWAPKPVLTDFLQQKKVTP